MGCGGSKKKDTGPKIPTVFKPNQVKKHDEIFVTKAQPLLVKAEQIRSGLVDSLKEACTKSNAKYCKPEDKQLEGCIQVLFWTLSAEANGQIRNTGT